MLLATTRCRATLAAVVRHTHAVGAVLPLARRTFCLCTPRATQAADTTNTTQQTPAAATPATPSVVPKRPIRPTLPTRAVHQPPPSFNSFLKKFNLLVHPDLFGDTPHHQQANQQSLQTLNSLVSSLKTRDSQEDYPPKQHFKLVFYLKKRRGDDAFFKFIQGHNNDTTTTTAAASNNSASSSIRNKSSRHPRLSGRSSSPTPSSPPSRGDVLPGEFHTIPVSLSTTGGMCKHLVARQFSAMFLRAGLPAKQFEWDAEYWQMGGPKERNIKGDVGEEGEGEEEDGEFTEEQEEETTQNNRRR